MMLAAGPAFAADATPAAAASGGAAKPATAAPSTPPVPPNLKPRRSGEENVFTDERGFSIYTSDEDSEPGVSKCYDACAKAWPPFPAAADAQPTGSFAILERADGIRQWVYRGKPLYLFAKDEYPGGTFGDGVGNRWRLAFGVLRSPPGIGVFKTPIGRILVNEKGLTLYAPKAGSQALKSGCDAACLRDWLPTPAPALARDAGDWTVLARPDGTRQWAFKGQPLYASHSDRRAGDLRGQEIGGADWTPIVIQPESPAPAWTTLVKTDLGQLYANEKGMTIYAFNGKLDQIKKLTCDEACIAKAWTPVPASAEVAPIGDWSVKKGADGKLYWAYRGAPLYTFFKDKLPGDAIGGQYASGANIFGNWLPIVRIPY
jgi:predicted lipoprotein with Yx(FWY)xxD motif